MNKIIIALLFCAGLISCKKKEDLSPELMKETSVAGTTTILVDETIFPVVEDLLIRSPIRKLWME